MLVYLFENLEKNQLIELDYLLVFDLLEKKLYLIEYLNFGFELLNFGNLAVFDINYNNYYYLFDLQYFCLNNVIFENALKLYHHLSLN